MLSCSLGTEQNGAPGLVPASRRLPCCCQSHSSLRLKIWSAPKAQKRDIYSQCTHHWYSRQRKEGSQLESGLKALCGEASTRWQRAWEPCTCEILEGSAGLTWIWPCVGLLLFHCTLLTNFHPPLQSAVKGVPAEALK